ncbi:DNA topoisomerase I [Tissierella praeacuta DSM 18095]|uniref:DNA topoisomerase 1 n=1 Tax=Tissierella praeacuta DSM 18095 TaxID=1123404 RepID=A0A1M4SMG4_9FIRM|nr:type I DNA topoisomerase [Tissierella praeacuta]TCU70599.1 DNA topoisomerase-1 [Tissierella praeacuta]SHE33385.1 DNA topoisomerase I [Tissierella praeacuta DSM 18095]SUP01573.1 DNA topoisomerase 1 [Tissierella praeacuta]
MQKNLVIVESPAKAKTIERFLGRNYKVVASIGHIRDLPKSSLGIDIEKQFEPKYITIRGKGPVIKDLKDEAKKSNKIFLATDPDREGEAISWHLAHILGIEENQKVRVEFNEITKESITSAIKKPRAIDLNLVDAQQARRILDRLVGYKISPLLWRKIRKGLSAGRVQSVVVKLICDRENEIQKFIPAEYWSIKVNLEKDKEKFEASFYGENINGKEKKVELKNKLDVDNILGKINKDNFVVKNVKKGTKKRNPYPPYTTSTLQQDASKKLGFTTKKTMIIAQQLYEGIDIKGEGSVGLITYMRTDSTRISKEAIEMANLFIKDNYGEKYTDGGRDYNNKSKKDSQDAHEGIRPTSITKIPNLIKDSLTQDQFKLYKMIWERFVGSQMTPAIYNTISVTIESNNILFKSSGSKLIFDGFLKVYTTIDEEEKDIGIPLLNIDDKLILNDIIPNQHFTQPPPRYTEASLIKTLEELGIGRPSTFSPTISTILAREYVVLDKKSFMPTELGVLVNDLLIEYFKDIVNEEFTAELEESLDEIAEGELHWVKVVENFYKDFELFLKKAEEEIKEIEIKDEVSDEICEKCGRNMVIKHGRFGKFLACPGYPECKNTKAIVDELNVKCPQCNGNIVKRKSKKGRVFYGCSNYPECNFVSWDEPVEEKCPQCGGIMVEKRNKKEIIVKCMDKECGYTNVKKV